MIAQFDDAAKALVSEHVRRLLDIMGIENTNVSCEIVDDSMLRVLIEAGQSGRLLIGGQGMHLAALQHIVRCLLHSHISRDICIIVDVNGYRIRREQSLLELAKEVAKKANRTGKSVMLQPMTATDRRTIHTALANNKGVRTESTGDGPDRRVVIRPIFL